MRLIELISVLSKEKMILVGRQAKQFMDRIKFMLEWANVKASDILNNLDLEIGRIEDNSSS